MAKNSITDYDNTAANNTDVQSVDISEGCSPSGINNAIREVMADLADVNDGTVALTSPVASAMSVTTTLTAGGIDINGNEFILDADGDTSITADTDDQIDFKTGGSDRVTIDASGNVGIGTTSPSSALHLSGATTPEARQTFTHTTAGLSSQLQQGSTGFGLSALGSQTINFDTNGSERMRILSSGGITFNGDTASANALDDYEEGTWTPADGSGAGLTFTSSGTPYYTKVGNLVTVQAFIIVPSTSNTNTFTITGLPYNIATNSYGAGSAFNNANLGHHLVYVEPTAGVFYVRDDNNVNLTNANMSGKFVCIGVTYRAS